MGKIKIVREALEQFLEEEIRKQARESLLKWIKNQELTEKRRQQLLKAWNEYQEKERKIGRSLEAKSKRG